MRLTLRRWQSPWQRCWLVPVSAMVKITYKRKHWLFPLWGRRQVMELPTDVARKWLRNARRDGNCRILRIDRRDADARPR